MTILIAGNIQNVKIHNYVDALSFLGMDPVVSLEITDPSDFAGLLLPGGGDIDPALYGEKNTASRVINRQIDDLQLRATDMFVRAGKPIMGVCKGMQILNVYFGGTLTQHLETEIVHKRDGVDIVHECRSVPGSDMEQLYGPVYRVNSVHHQAVNCLGNGLQATSASADGVIESVLHRQLPVFGVQCHPERMCFSHARSDTIDGRLLFRYFRAML